jgi:hypothetical protein
MYKTTDIEGIGIVFDMSLRRGSNKQRNIDNVKHGLIEFIRNNLEEDDMMYLYHPEIIEVEDKVGAHVGAISNYKTDGWKFDVNMALQQTLFVISGVPCEKRTVILITDRLSDVAPLKRIWSFNKKDDLGCRIVCVDIGSHLPDVDFLEVFHVFDSSDLFDSTLFKEIIHGENIICSTSCDTK